MKKFDYNYRKAINVTAWVLQILICIILLGVSAWFLSYIKGATRNNVYGLVSGAAGIQIAITALTIIFDILEIVFISKGVMHPGLYLSSACVKSAIWSILFILNCIALSIISIILCLILAGTSIMQLIYGARLVHRHRKGTLKGGKYAPAATGHVEGNIYGGAAHTQPYDTNGPAYPAIPAQYAQHQPQQTGYYSQPQQPQQQYQQQAHYGAPTEYKSPVPSPAPQQQYGVAAPPAAGGYYAGGAYELNSRQ